MSFPYSDFDALMFFLPYRSCLQSFCPVDDTSQQVAIPSRCFQLFCSNNSHYVYPIVSSIKHVRLNSRQALPL